MGNRCTFPLRGGSRPIRRPLVRSKPSGPRARPSRRAALLACGCEQRAGQSSLSRRSPHLRSTLHRFPANTCLREVFRFFRANPGNRLRDSTRASRSWFAERLAEIVRSERGRLAADVVVPVPLHGQRQRERGYTQAARIQASCKARLLMGTEARPDKAGRTLGVGTWRFSCASGQPN